MTDNNENKASIEDIVDDINKIKANIELDHKRFILHMDRMSNKISTILQQQTRLENNYDCLIKLLKSHLKDTNE